MLLACWLFGTAFAAVAGDEAFVDRFRHVREHLDAAVDDVEADPTLGLGGAAAAAWRATLQRQNRLRAFAGLAQVAAVAYGRELFAALRLNY